jgi:hypothetical protein
LVGATSAVLVGAVATDSVGAGVVCRLVERLVARADCASFSTAGEGSAFRSEVESAVGEESRAVGAAESIVAILSAAGVELSSARLVPVPSAKRTTDVRHRRYIR